MFQVRAWETRFGSSYEEALANSNPQNGRLALAGESGILRVWTSYPFADPPIPAAQLVGWPAVVGAPLGDGFVLNVVPEPGLKLLMLLALPVLLFQRLRPKRMWNPVPSRQTNGSRPSPSSQTAQSSSSLGTIGAMTQRTSP